MTTKLTNAENVAPWESLHLSDACRKVVVAAVANAAVVSACAERDTAAVSAAAVKHSDDSPLWASCLCNET